MLHKIKKDGPTLDTVIGRDTVEFLADGKVAEKANDPLAVARQIVYDNGEAAFYLKTSGSFLYNPFGDSVFTKKLTATKNGKACWAYKKVSMECFQHYLRYLKKKNQANFREAERLLVHE